MNFKAFLTASALGLLFSQGAFAQMPGTFTPLTAVSAVQQTDCTGGTVTYSGGKTIHTFISSVDVICSSPHTVDYLAYGGAGGGGGYYYSGGGGAGGLKFGSLTLPLGNTPIVVGAAGPGGAPSAAGSKGGDTSIGALVTAHGGGGGGTYSGGPGGNGASGGGVGAYAVNTTRATGMAGEGNAGGINPVAGGAAGGGGGYGGQGGDATATKGGDGGPGYSSSISGILKWYVAGGGGAYYSGGPGTGGSGVGGNGGTTCTPGVNGSGGGGTYSGPPCAGGDGGVVISYPTGIIPPPPPCTANTQNGTFANVVALWHLDNNGIDTSGKGMNLTLDGPGTYSTVQSKFGGYAYRGGSSASATSIINGPSMTDFTIEFWFYTSVVQGNLTLFSDQAVSMWMFFSGSTAPFVSRTNGVDRTSTLAMSSYNGVWTALAWVRQAGVSRFYVNGASQALTGTEGTAATASAYKWTLGNQSTAAGGGYALLNTGYIDEVRISNVARYTGANYSVQATAFCDN